MRPRLTSAARATSLSDTAAGPRSANRRVAASTTAPTTSSRPWGLGTSCAATAFSVDRCLHRHPATADNTTMQLSDSQTALVASQLALAGLTLSVGVDQTLAWWRERARALRSMAVTSFALVAVLATNVAVAESSVGTVGEAALLARAAAI